MNKFLIAAGAGALLIVAQTAVSAAYNPLDRVDAPAKGDVAAPALATAAATSTDRGYTAFADRPVRADAGSDDLFVGFSDPRVTPSSDEVKPGRPANAPGVTDRVSGEPTSYNTLISQATTEYTMEQYLEAVDRFYTCGYGSCGGGGGGGGFGAWPVAVIGTAAFLGAVAVVTDDGESN